MSRVQAEWVTRIDEGVEQLTEALAATDVRRAGPRVEQFVGAIEAPADAMHGAVLASVLMDLGSRIVRALHAQNPPAPCGCEASIWAHVGRCEQWRADDPRPAFQEWRRLFFDDIERQHPHDAALVAAEAIRKDPARAWTLDALAELTGSGVPQFGRQFAERFGMRPAGYVQLVRVTLALPLLRTAAKVEGVAFHVGYKSKKDLYAALSRWTDSTPTLLRAMSGPESAWLEHQLLMRCFAGVSATSERSLRLTARDAKIDGGPGASGTRASRR